MRLMAENNPKWKGDDVGKEGLHLWVRSRLPKPKFCEICKEKSPHDLANKNNHQYRRDLNDWIWLCSKCHYEYDGRLEKHKIRMEKRKLTDKQKEISKLRIKEKMPLYGRNYYQRKMEKDPSWSANKSRKFREKNPDYANIYYHKKYCVQRRESRLFKNGGG